MGERPGDNTSLGRGVASRGGEEERAWDSSVSASISRFLCVELDEG